MQRSSQSGLYERVFMCSSNRFQRAWAWLGRQLLELAASPPGPSLQLYQMMRGSPFQKVYTESSVCSSHFLTGRLKWAIRSQEFHRICFKCVCLFKEKEIVFFKLCSWYAPTCLPASRGPHDPGWLSANGHKYDGTFPALRNQQRR